MNRIVKWIKNSAEITKSSSFLDVGCGNGLLLVKLVGTCTTDNNFIHPYTRRSIVVSK